MENRQLIKNIIKYINEQRISQEIKNVIRDTYIDYEDAYKRYLSNLEKEIGNDSKLLFELDNIASYAKREYEGDKASTKEIDDMFFEAKIDNMKEHILATMRNMLENEEHTETSKGLKPILDTEEEKDDSQFIRKCINFSKDNRDYALQIKESVVFEIETSKKNIISKVTKNIPQKEINLEYINYATRAFENEVNIILNKAKIKVPTTIKEELDSLDDKIVSDIIDMYTNEMHGKNNEKEQREEFIADLKVKVDEGEAVKKVLEEQKKLKMLEKDEKQEENLPDNVIE